MPRSMSLAPSSRITRSGLSASDQSSRARPPAVVSPETPGIDDMRVDPVGAQPRFELRREALARAAGRTRRSGCRRTPGSSASAAVAALRRPSAENTASSRATDANRAHPEASLPASRCGVASGAPHSAAGCSRVAHQRRPPRATVSSSRRSSAAMMRGRSAAGRFWLSLNLPSSRLTAISIPTMPLQHRVRDRPAAGRASATARPRAPRAAPTAGRASRAASPRSLDRAHRAVGVHRGVIPGRHGRTGLVPARRDIGVRPREDRQHLAAAVEIGDLRIGAREMALQQQPAVAARSTRNGIWLAISSAASPVGAAG